MKRLRIERWGGARSLTRLTRPRPQCPFMQHQHQHIQPQRRQAPSFRLQSTSSTASIPSADQYEPSSSTDLPEASPELESLPSPPISAASKSGKLSALHARLYLPLRLPLETLARTLVDPSADANPDFNNASLATLGRDILGYFISEHILCHYPRLPMPVIFAAQAAYIGDKALAAIMREWGVELAAAPGGEVDPGLLQFTYLEPGTQILRSRRGTDGASGYKALDWKRGLGSRIVHDDEFGESRGRAIAPDSNDRPAGVTLEHASAGFVRAVVGAVYAHAGRVAAQEFIAAHFLSRHLDLVQLFDFRTPTRDLSKLCAREGFEAPVARLIAETGRASRTPVFVVGVYSGRDKLGEGAGASMDEGRIRAAAAALKGWYLYSPLEVTKPSEVEGVKGSKRWVPNLVDMGEVIV